MIDVFSAFGLSSAAGLNAWLPLLIVGLTARYTDLIALSEPWNALESTWVLGVLGVLLAIEITVDKIPAVDTVNDVIHTVVRPAAGAVLFASSSNVVSDVNPALAMVCGLLVAGGVHAAKATARPVITASTAGIGNPVVSLLEDIVSAITAIVSIVLPVLATVVIVILLALFAWWFFRRRRRRLSEA
ncbi:MAG: DUF4126 domain-containing protein [Anaerolineae bacterium]